MRVKRIAQRLRGLRDGSIAGTALPARGDRELTDAEVPMPPENLRRLTGRVDPVEFQNPSGDPVYGYLPRETYQSVLDFGCGCGRVARQMLLQREPPAQYLGIDLHRGEIEWCQRNLHPLNTAFRFVHHDVHNPLLNPGTSKPKWARFPTLDATVTMVNALSTYTHTPESAAAHYLAETARVLRSGGVLHATWFLFDKREFPGVPRSGHALYVDEHDPTNAVYLDRNWLLDISRDLGLWLTQAFPPGVRGFQWTLVMTKDEPGHHIELPLDVAPVAQSLPW